ncbi:MULTISPECIES: hypothetical protein [Pseudothermotoga]|uniref:Uncharacterized protein n=1 Tax=Pseudothermotoga lettingae (strain ATCC BAA-301 / DSM 14385 / NBRC 107922 / TMO) TaxID=416591 RepID=A8F5E6_PSELT|nr:MULTISPECIES: hypothetical protein [Pseudothermotoga]ABV33380.1 hypothetical protein Tlet_0814 [Pseudothermotoga lettingae TMO]KUK21456.1 MAG: Uncharacterized protein XD56_0631 [Pseudothermotoga lettingae]MDI3495109.1 hypothetical protein [Pseudothermotoga sp.]MDK2884450.1 hypothetical protein [Pseudothermotoga sp.]GLI49705.1 hypothetical protein PLETTINGATMO_18740 [Pseudothermotoga lettingae TMO]
MKIILAIIGALMLIYIGSKLLQMRVKSIAIVYSFFVGLYALFLVVGNIVPIIIYLIGEAVVIWVIVIFMGI